MNPKQKYLREVLELKKAQEGGRRKCSLHHSAFKWVLENIQEGTRILEFGSGKSSRTLSLLYKIDTIEHDKRYFRKYAASDGNGPNYIFAPIKDYGEYYWYDLAPIKKGLAENYSMIIVDGPTGKTGREGFAANYNALFSGFGCPVLIDETDRKQEKRMGNCFLSNGFQTICKGNKFEVLQGAKSKKLSKKSITALIECKNLVVCSVGDSTIPSWLEEKGDYDTCIIHHGSDVPFGFRLKAFADYFLSEKGSLEHNYETAFKEVPKALKYGQIIFVKENENISAKEVEARFLQPRKK